IRARVLRGLASAIGGPLPRLRVGLLLPAGAVIPTAVAGTSSPPTRSAPSARAACAGARAPVHAGVGAGAPGWQRHEQVLGQRRDEGLVHPAHLGKLVVGTRAPID